MNIPAEQEKELVGGLHKAMAAVDSADKQSTVRPIKPADRPQRSLAEQLHNIENINAALRDTIRRKVVEIRALHETRKAEIQIAYDRDVLAASRQRDRALEAAEADAREKLAELEVLVSRMR